MTLHRVWAIAEGECGSFISVFLSLFFLFSSPSDVFPPYNLASVTLLAIHPKYQRILLCHMPITNPIIRNRGLEVSDWPPRSTATSRWHHDQHPNHGHSGLWRNAYSQEKRSDCYNQRGTGAIQRSLTIIQAYQCLLEWIASQLWVQS